MTAGEGVELLHQAGVQQFLWYDLPRKFDEHRWESLVAGAAALFDELSLPRYAGIARSDRTAEIVAAWRKDFQLGWAGALGRRIPLPASTLPTPTCRVGGDHEA